MTNKKELFKDFEVGDYAEFSEVVSENTINQFAELSKDKNPLHVDPAYAEQTHFKKPIAHGMFAGALLSRLVGMYLPGKYALYVRQTLNFKAPIYVGVEVTVCGEIIKKTTSFNLLTLSTKVFQKNTNQVFVEGEALVKVLK